MKAPLVPLQKENKLLVFCILSVDTFLSSSCDVKIKKIKTIPRVMQSVGGRQNSNHETFASCRQTLFGARVRYKKSGNIAICRWTLLSALGRRENDNKPRTGLLHLFVDRRFLKLEFDTKSNTNPRQTHQKALILSSSENGVFMY